MTEQPPGLPSPIPAPPYPSTEAGFGAASAAAGRRRRRQAALGGGGAVTALALWAAAVLVASPSGPQVLDQAERPQVVPRSAVPTPAPLPVVVAASPSAASTVLPTPVPLPTLVVEVRPSSSARPSTTPSARPSAASGGEELSGPEPTFTDYEVGQDCDGSGYTAANGWCSAHSGARTARRGSTVELATSLCRLPGQPDGELRAASGQYAEFVVSDDGGGNRWTWSRGKRFTDEARPFTVPAGRCLRLAVSWDLRDDAGRALPVGEYVLTSSPYLSTPGVFVREQKPITFIIT